MTPVMQSKLYAPDAIHNGNCFAACLASLLDLPLWMVPPFEDMFGRADWRHRVDEWLQRVYRRRLVHVDGHAMNAMPAYYIANGPSARRVQHSVIYHAGALAHDPHPSQAGIVSVEWTWHFEPAQGKQKDVCER